MPEQSGKYGKPDDDAVRLDGATVKLMLRPGGVLGIGEDFRPVRLLAVSIPANENARAAKERIMQDMDSRLTEVLGL